MEEVQEKIYEAICRVASQETFFYVGFDMLFEFMCQNPYSTTTRNFIEYHIQIGDPRLDDGMPCFGYLIGRKFILRDWVSEEDIEAFCEFAIMKVWDNLAN